MFELTTTSAANKYQFQSVPNDLMDVKKYTLANGLTLFLSPNKEEPRIFTNIVVRAGSKYDPADCTGLAHYLEHMMFKGTSRIGALDWEKERVLLTQISDLYETHKQTTDPEHRAEIYRQIDAISNEAAKLVAANEYDKLASALGARATNAYTWVEQTVYVNDIPNNELERWMKLEAERFSMVALRLFHTELETVYEEFNISQDKDIRKALKSLNEAVFPTHPYGTQTTIGEGEHLKSPSHRSIQAFFSTYYVPNNIGIVLAGDFDEQAAVAFAEKYWGNMPSKPLPKFQFEEQPTMTEPVRREVVGKEGEFLLMSWRMPKAASEDSILLELVAEMLYNGQAGLIDLALNNQQKVLKSQMWAQMHEDYSTLQAYALPRQGQTLEEVEQLLLSQIERIKTGDFPDWLMPAVITNLKLAEIKRVQQNEQRVSIISNCFIMGVDWATYCDRITQMEQLTKADIMRFANTFLNHYAIVYKRLGEDEKVMKVAKPPITPVTLNRDAASDFAQAFFALQTPETTPQFIDYEKAIQKKSLQKGLDLFAIAGTTPGFFELHYVYEMGKLADRHLGIVVLLLPYLGTDKYSAAQLQQEFFKLGLFFQVTGNDDRTYVSLSGLEENMEAGIDLVEHILQAAVSDAIALQNVVNDCIKNVENNKKNREYILRTALLNYAKFGEKSPFLDNFTAAQLKALNGDELVQRIKSLSTYEHEILYVGAKNIDNIANIIKQKHQTSSNLQPIKTAKNFTELPTTSKVLLVDFPIIQMDMLWLSKGDFGFQMQDYLIGELYNDYFGYGLSSIFFQEIREARALGYTASTYYASPSKNDRSHYLQAYLGTQPDKLRDAMPPIKAILEQMPISPAQIENARTSILKRLASSRYTGANIFWQYKSNQMRGIKGDLRQHLYEAMQSFDVKQLIDFHQKNIKNNTYTMLILGNKNNLDLDYLSQWGDIEELSLEMLFGE